MASEIHNVLQPFGLPAELGAVGVGGSWQAGSGDLLTVRSPINGQVLASFSSAAAADVPAVLAAAESAFLAWREVPPPARGELVRRLGLCLRERKNDLAQLVSWEAGKILQESLGEVQEMIDICDFAVGLSRQLYGRTIASERARHRLTEQWHPLGPVGVISAFNFPVAVWAWNAALAFVCGNPVVWKPSEKTPLCALACQSLLDAVVADTPAAPKSLSCVLVGGADVGESLARAAEIRLLSATGSVRMGRAVAPLVAARLGRSLLELGGNNALVAAPSANLELAVRSVVFAAVGTCGQRCTSLRRLIVHASIATGMVDRLKRIYAELPHGNPLDDGVLVGPLIDENAWLAMQSALEAARQQGGVVHGGERINDAVQNDAVQNNTVPTGGVYVRPAIVEIAADAPIVQQETFAPILYVLRYREFDEAIAMHNSVSQGLSSAIFTNDVAEAELFCSAFGSDCGIVNVNVGTSGAEIGGAFGGEKETGGGRESGSDAWKTYMRRTTNTINFSGALPLAQGIQFDI